MLEITYRDFGDRNFNVAVGKILNYPGFKDHRFNYRMAKFGKKFLEEQRLYDAARGKMLGRWADIDKAKNHYEIRREVLEDPEQNAAYEKDIEDFEKVVVQMDYPRIPLTQISEVNLTPIELGAIDNLIIEMETISKAPVKRKK